MRMIPVDDILDYAIPWDDYVGKWRFVDDNDELPPKEHLDQIWPLTSEASKVLIQMENAIGLTRHYDKADKYFKTTEQFILNQEEPDILKKWLYNRGIPFSNVVFVTYSTEAIAMTWKMVMKYWDGIFIHDCVLWDETVNWCVYYDHNDVLVFGKDRIFDGEGYQLSILELKKQITAANNA